MLKESDLSKTSASTTTTTKKNDRRNKSSIILPRPATEQVEHYLLEWASLESYVAQEKALGRLFVETFPNNTDILEVLLKVSTLNDFYSTNIFKVYPVAEHIVAIEDIDKRLKEGDLSLVEEIQNSGSNNRKFYSFATKYCSHHNPLDFPIYDRYVDMVLRYYRRIDKFATFKNEELKDYALFKETLVIFKEYYDLNYSFKDLDKYIWQLGKDHFNPYP